MPLFSGKKNIGQNIKTEEAAGKGRKQAVAIALHKADDTGLATAPSAGLPTAARNEPYTAPWQGRTVQVISTDMLEAGTEAFWSLLGSAGAKLPANFDASGVLSAVYSAMRALERTDAGKRPLTLRLDTADLERALAEFRATVDEFRAALEAATTEDDEVG